MGELWIDGAFYCDTLEPPLSRPHHPAILSGTYSVVMYPSAKFRGMRPLLCGVQGRSGILIHEGNRASQSLGCILVGAWDGRSGLVNSRERLKPLIKWIDGELRKGQSVQICIVS